MSVRAFTVFQDTPSVETSEPRVTSPSATTLASLTEKENVHPLTGERTGPDFTSKKRKTTVLATKVHMPLTTKKQTDDSKHESKKRKSASSSSLKTKSTLKRGGKVKASKRSTRKLSSPLPKVDEEVALEKEQRVAQAHIDSKCYELTVQPLADVTPAYEQSPSFEDIISGEKAKLCFAKVR